MIIKLINGLKKFFIRPKMAALFVLALLTFAFRTHEVTGSKSKLLVSNSDGADVLLRKFNSYGELVLLPYCHVNRDLVVIPFDPQRPEKTDWSTLEIDSLLQNNDNIIVTWPEDQKVNLYHQEHCPEWGRIRVRDLDLVATTEKTTLPVQPLTKPIPATVAAMSRRIKSFVTNPKTASVIHFAVQHHLDHSEYLCYRYVKKALLGGGLVKTYLNGGSAALSGPELKAQGFTNLLDSEFFKQKMKSPYDAPIGAILVYNGGPYGHIEIRTETGFVSDYYSANARTGSRSNGLSGRGRKLIGIYIK